MPRTRLTAIRTCLLLLGAMLVPVAAAAATKSGGGASKSPQSSTHKTARRGAAKTGAAKCAANRNVRRARTAKARRVALKACLRRLANVRKTLSPTAPRVVPVLRLLTAQGGLEAPSDLLAETIPSAEGSPQGSGGEAGQGGSGEAGQGGSGSGESEEASSGETGSGGEGEPGDPLRFFAPNSIWNTPLTTAESIDPQSEELVQALYEEIKAEQHAKTGPWINTSTDSIPVYTVPADQATVSVALEHELEPALASSWHEVPLPEDAKPGIGSDHPLVVWQPETDRLWEFWRLEGSGTSWSASWGGSLMNASRSSGVFGPEAWPGAEPWWGASATSLSLAGGLITLHDLEVGHIDHALAIAIPQPRKGAYALPARREDGISEALSALPEGAHLRIDPSFDLSSVRLPKLALMMAEAAQRYGIIVRDRAGNVAFYGQDPTPTGSNPYAGSKGWFGGKYPNQLLANFPWTHLQVLNMTLREG